MKTFVQTRKEMIDEAIAQGIRRDEICWRRTGATTAWCLFFISDAMMKHRQWIPIRNHGVDGMPSTKQMDKLAFEKCRELIKQLKLEGFEFSKTKLAIKYDVWVK